MVCEYSNIFTGYHEFVVRFTKIRLDTAFSIGKHTECRSSPILIDSAYHSETRKHTLCGIKIIQPICGQPYTHSFHEISLH